MIYKTHKVVFQKRLHQQYHPSKPITPLDIQSMTCYHLHPQASLIHFSIFTFSRCIPLTQECSIICSGLGLFSKSFSKLFLLTGSGSKDTHHILRKCLNAAVHFKFFSGSSSRSCAISVTSRYCTKSIIERGGCPGGGKGNLACATSINEIPRDHRSDRILYE